MYEPQDASVWRSSRGQTLLHVALHNCSPPARVAIANRLLGGVDAAAVTSDEQNNALHVLFAENLHDFALEARLLNAGAPANRG